jgi:hypothetical protein
MKKLGLTVDEAQHAMSLYANNKKFDKLHLDPFEPENTLVMVGMLDDLGHEDIVTFDHSEQQPTTTQTGRDFPSNYAQRITRLDVAVGVWLYLRG